MSRAAVKIRVGTAKAGKKPAPYTDEVRRRLMNETRGALGHFLVTVRAGDVRAVIHAAQVREDLDAERLLELRRLRGENLVLREHIAAGAKLLGDTR